MRRILITGSAGFIGHHLIQGLSTRGENLSLTGLDNINDYYSVDLKYARLEQQGIKEPRALKNGNLVRVNDQLSFIRMDLVDKEGLESLFHESEFDVVIHLAAQAGVRYSMVNPDSYVQSNLVGFVNMLEMCRKFPVKHLVYASSSSVYGTNHKVPFVETDRVDAPISLYAATKRSNELLAYTYAYLFDIPMTGLRFFTVYGPWGRPDMAYFKFAESIAGGRPIDVYNYGEMRRDFTYVDDIVEGIIRVTFEAIPTEKTPPFELLNIGNSNPVLLKDFIAILEQKLGKSAEKKYCSMQSGDAVETFADTSRLESLVSFRPKTSLASGLECFVTWFRNEWPKTKVCTNEL